MCSTPCTSRSLQRILVTKVSGKLLPHLFTLTKNWRYLSVALFLESPRLDVIKRDCSAVLGLSSQITLRVCPTNMKYYSFKFSLCQDDTIKIYIIEIINHFNKSAKYDNKLRNNIHFYCFYCLFL